MDEPPHFDPNPASPAAGPRPLWFAGLIAASSSLATGLFNVAFVLGPRQAFVDAQYPWAAHFVIPLFSGYLLAQWLSPERPIRSSVQAAAAGILALFGDQFVFEAAGRFWGIERWFWRTPGWVLHGAVSLWVLCVLTAGPFVKRRST